MRCERVIVGAAMVFLTLLFPLRAFAQCYPETYGADPTDQIDDDWAIQQCLNQGGTTMLSPGTPGYLIAGGLQITVDGTTLTAPVRANLKADPVLTEAILQIGSDARYVSNVTLSNVLINGDMWNRDQGLCSGYRGPESNVLIRANNFLIDNVTSKQALCGSSMEVSGSGYEIRNSLFTSNGEQRSESTAPEPWSDGLTLLLCASGNVHDNRFVDNTDVDLVVGGGAGCQIWNNNISNPSRHGFAGLHVGHFDNGQGDHSGSSYYNNTISAAANMLSFGVVVGFHPWNSTVDLKNAGAVTTNTISGAVINLAIEADSQNFAGGQVTGNSVSGAQGTQGFGSCQISQNYTVNPLHAGQITYDGGWFNLKFDDGACTPQ